MVCQNLIRLGVKEGCSIAAAVSGGADSMALLHCLCALARRLRFKITVCHMEHGIRGETSRRDMEFVKAECERLGVPFAARQADVPALAKSKGISVEAAAREARYEFLDECETDYIATAHHMEDAAETVIMNLVRGSGLAGLCGMPEKRGRYIRPMLDIPKEEIDEYVRANGISFMRDETNCDTAYTRNYVRAEILPRLKRINAAASENITRAARLLSEDEEALKDAAWKSGCVEYSEEGALIGLEAFSKLMTAVKKRVLRLAVSYVRPTEDLENVHVQSLLELAETAVSGKRLDIGKGAFAAVVYGKLLIGKNGPERYNNISTALREGSLEFGGFCFECESFSKEPVFGKGVEYFDKDAVSGAVFRNRKDGDVIKPLGMNGTKPLADYLSDRKVPLHKRDGLAVLACGEQVFWVVGLGVSEISKARLGNKLYRIRYWENRKCTKT